MTGPGPLSKGTSLVTLQAYLVEKHGAEAWEQLIAQLPPADAEALKGIPLPQRDYPTTSIMAALDTTRELFGPDDFHYRYGEWAARHQINAFFRFLLRFRSPGWVVGRSAQVWRRFHSTGDWRIEYTDHRFRGVLTGFVKNGRYCQVLMGWMCAAARMTGGAQPHAAHPACTARGAPACEFVVDW